MAELPLEGIRVLDITVVYAGPFATMILADLGAEVIRVESTRHWQTNTRGVFARPPKEFVKRQAPYFGGYPNRDPGKRPWNRHPWFNVHAHNKLSMTLDLKQPKGMQIFRRLVRVSDVVIENNAFGTMEKLGITYDMLKEVKPDIIMARQPAWGLTGPYREFRAFGMDIETISGHRLLRGYADTDPSTQSFHVPSDSAAGSQTAFAIICALIYRKQTGKGQFIESALAENFFPWLGQAILDFSMNKRIQGTLGNRDPSAIQGCYRCKGEDRWVNITIFNDEEWDGFCRALGHPDWTKKDDFSNALNRYRNHDELDKHIEKWTSQHDPFEIMHLLQHEGVPAAPVEDPRDNYNDPHLKARGFFEEVTHEDAGTYLHPGMLWKMSKSKLGVRMPPCRLGEHNEYIYKEVIGVSDEEYRELEAEGHIGMDYVPEIP
jgi:crotonobetainyl-CoA:carnitine CoA-transferase CaiB-like acyl-CoA transferase